MNVRQIMTSPVVSARPDDSIFYAAKLMADEDVGALPIVENGRVVGIVTDRDIATRAVAGGTPPQALLKRIMTDVVVSCSPDDDLEHVLELMSNEQIRRLPVCEERGKLVGIVALADAAEHDPNKSEVGKALDEIVEPSGIHSQAPVFA